MSKKLKSKKGEVSFNKADLPYPKEIIEKVLQNHTSVRLRRCNGKVNKFIKERLK